MRRSIVYNALIPMAVMAIALAGCGKDVSYRDGTYIGQSSVRESDGGSFLSLLAPFRAYDGSVVFDADTRAMITTRKLNLAELDSPLVAAALPREQNIVFLRNVFIYFAPELRARILRTVAEQCMAAGGYLFVSMSEIAQIDSTLMPPCLEKIVDGTVFYFHKKMEK